MILTAFAVRDAVPPHPTGSRHQGLLSAMAASTATCISCILQHPGTSGVSFYAGGCCLSCMRFRFRLGEGKETMGCVGGAGFTFRVCRGTRVYRAALRAPIFTERAPAFFMKSLLSSSPDTYGSWMTICETAAHILRNPVDNLRLGATPATICTFSSRRTSTPAGTSSRHSKNGRWQRKISQAK